MTSPGGHVQYVYDPKEALSARELCDRHAHDLPLLVVVSHGFYGNRDEMCFSTGQVLRLQEVRQQRRALVHDNQKKTLSVPLDFSHLFYLAHAQTKAMTMGDIMERYDLPVKVKFADTYMRFDCGPEHTTRSLSTLKIIRQHEETYFVANTVMQGQLLETVIPIPFYLKDVRFCVVTGVKGRGLRDGGRGHIQALLYSQAEHLDFSQDHGDTEMVQLSEKPIKVTDNIYQNIDTNLYINVREQRQQQRPQAQRPSHAEQPQREPSQRQLQRRPPPPLPPPSPSPPSSSPPPPVPPELSGPDAATSSGLGVVPYADEEYMNFNTLQRSRMSKGSPATGDPALVGGSFGGQSAGDDVYYDPSREGQSDAGVYEPVIANLPHPHSNYTALIPQSSTDSQPEQTTITTTTTTTALPSMALELQKALEKRKRQAATAGLQDKNPATQPPVPNTTNTPSDSTQDQKTPWKVNLRPTPQKSQGVLSNPESEAIIAGANSAAGKSATLPLTGHGKAQSAAVTKPALKAKPLLSSKPSGGKNVKESMSDPQQPLAQRFPSPNTSGTSVKQKTKVFQAAQPVPRTVSPEVKDVQATPEQQTAAAASSQPDQMYVNQREMAVVVPTRSVSPSGQSQGGTEQRDVATVSGRDQGKGVSSPLIQTQTTKSPDTALLTKAQHSLSLDQPLDSWAIQDVQLVLSRLNLHTKYGDAFRDQLIDGTLLQQLTRDMLKEEFGMSLVEIQRLRNFVETGHLPK